MEKWFSLSDCWGIFEGLMLLLHHVPRHGKSCPGKELDDTVGVSFGEGSAVTVTSNE